MAARPYTLEEVAALAVTSPPSPTQAWPTSVSHLSATSLCMFARCPEQYRRRYICGEKSRPSAAMIWGGSDHKAIAWGLEQQIGDNGRHADVGDVLDVFSTSWDAEVSFHGDEVEWDEDKPGAMKDQAAALVRTYHTSVSPAITPIKVEQKFERRVADVPVPLIGYIDIETQAKVIDRKTSRRRESKPKPDWRVQGMLYAAPLNKPVEFHVSAKTQRPMVYTPMTDPELAMAAPNLRLADRWVQTHALKIAWCYSTFGPDDAWPDATTHPWACGFCSYRPTCFWWA